MHIRPNRSLLAGALLIGLVAAAILYLNSVSQRDADQTLRASGTVETVMVVVAPELPGRVVEVLVNEGDRVTAGQPLLLLDDTVWQAQRRQAEAGAASAETALSQAQAALHSARAAQDSAESRLPAAALQLDIARTAAQSQDAAARRAAWTTLAPDALVLPVWYFQTAETLAATESELHAAQTALETEQAQLSQVVNADGRADFVAAEQRLATAQTAYLIAADIRQRAGLDVTPTPLQAAAQTQLDAADAELADAQAAYDALLTGDAATDVLAARARVAVAQARLDAAQDRFNQLHAPGDGVRAAEIGVAQAEAGVRQAAAGVAQAEAAVTQAERAMAQAQAQLDLINVQMQRLTVRAGAGGVILTRAVEPGEVVQAGAALLNIGQIDRLTITVYVPEARYGEVQLGQTAQVTVDSFPGEVFSATVRRIADRAEYTPRNVQTQAGRRATVFAVALAVEAGDGRLKPGMPADVVFQP